MTNEFLLSFSQLLREEFKADNNFCLQLEQCKTFAEVKEFMIDNSEEFSEFLGLDDEIEELKDEVKGLKDEIWDLERDISNLEDEVEELEEKTYIGFIPDTLWDEQKIETFTRHHEKFSPSEFEALLGG